MKKAFVDILIGAVTITAAVYLLNKFFMDSAIQDGTADSSKTTDQQSVVAIVDECTFPQEMRLDMIPDEVSNWGTLTKQSYLNHNPDDQ